MQDTQRIVNIAAIGQHSYFVSENYEFSKNALDYDMVLVTDKKFNTRYNSTYTDKIKERRYKVNVAEMDNDCIKFMIELRDKYGFDLDDGRQVQQVAKTIAAIHNCRKLSLEHLKEAFSYHPKKFKVDCEKKV